MAKRSATALDAEKILAKGKILGQEKLARELIAKGASVEDAIAQIKAAWRGVKVAPGKVESDGA